MLKYVPKVLDSE